MTETDQSVREGRLYRLDRFVVPAHSREEFVGRVRQTHEVLRRQPGFVRDFLLEQPAGPGETVVATLVEWESRDAIDAAVAAIREGHERSGFDPAEAIPRLTSKAEKGVYRQLA